MLYLNKYRIEWTRFDKWNYANEAMYSVTICTKDRKHYFGSIKDGVTNLSELGKIVEIEWKKTPDLRPDMNIELAEFVVMPNHFHGIVIINENPFNASGKEVNSNSDEVNIVTSRFAPQSKNLSSIIRGFKSAVTMYARLNKIPFEWQPRFHDRILRGRTEYEIRAHYILDNPANWEKDEFNKI